MRPLIFYHLGRYRARETCISRPNLLYRSVTVTCNNCCSTDLMVVTYDAYALANRGTYLPICRYYIDSSPRDCQCGNMRWHMRQSTMCRLRDGDIIL